MVLSALLQLSAVGPFVDLNIFTVRWTSQNGKKEKESANTSSPGTISSPPTMPQKNSGLWWINLGAVWWTSRHRPLKCPLVGILLLDSVLANRWCGTDLSSRVAAFFSPGSTFVVRLRYYLCPVSSHSSRIVITAELDWIKSSLLKGRITSSAKVGLLLETRISPCFTSLTSLFVGPVR